VIENTITAINYQYRQGPTRIDFRGTILLPDAKGEATVESKRGRTEVDANFERLISPQRFGREYLTYTLWAVTPEGGVRNLGEIVPGPSDKASMHVSTDLQAFALMVTAEPYSAGRLPSNVIVLENRVRPDTEGRVEQVQARYQLMPRGRYAWQEPDQLSTAVAGLPKVSMDRYEAILEIYEAQNALGIARAANAQIYAPETLAKAQKLYDVAQQMDVNRTAPKSVIVQNARQAVQTAEDARMIAERSQEQEMLAKAQNEAAAAQQAESAAIEQAREARAEAAEAQRRADGERAARNQAEADAAAARERAERASARSEIAAIQPQVVITGSTVDPRKAELRRELLQQLNGSIGMRDTPRGLVATIPDSAFTGSELHAPLAGQLEQIAVAIAAHPGLRIDVEGNTDTAATAPLSSQRAEAVRRALIAQGVSATHIGARGLGDSHPIGPNSSSAARAANRRVEVIISGDPIGNFPSWDRPYTLSPGPLSQTR
jgi:outer membrane protein OmpA-like peptidoglycan-associated protein